MSSADILSAITTVGFPIVMCLAMCYYIMKVNDQHTKDILSLNEKHQQEISDITTAINNNTMVIQKLCDKLELGDDK